MYHWTGFADRLRPTQARVIILLLAALVFLPPALMNPFAEDEACYSAIGRNVVETGDWLTFQYNGKPFWEKPPIVLWGISSSFAVFGAHEWSARIFSMLCGLGCLLIVFQFGRLKEGVAFGLLCALVLLTCQDFARFSARSQMDVPLTFLLTAGLFLFWNGLEKPWLHLLAGACFGLAIATKNQTGLWGWFVQLAYLGITRDGRALKQWQWYAAAPIGLAVAAPWFIHQYVTHGSAFVDSYYYYNFGIFEDQAAQQEAAGGVDYAFYVRYLWSGHVLVLVPAALAGLWTTYRYLRFGERLGVMLAIWAGLVLLVCSLCGRTLFWYLMPMYPAAAILIALGLSKTMLWTRYPGAVLRVAAVLALVIQASFYLPPPKWPVFYATKDLAPQVHAHVPKTEILYMITDRDDGRSPNLEPCEQATHYYCDRVARFLPTRGRIEEVLADGHAIYALGVPDMIEQQYRPALGNIFEAIAYRGPLCLYRVTPPALARRSTTANPVPVQ